jgi:hypothetical protein
MINPPRLIPGAEPNENAMTLVDDIQHAKSKAGSEAYLWAHDSGDVILWESEEDSVDSNGWNAVGRWRLDCADLKALMDSGFVDEIA